MPITSNGKPRLSPRPVVWDASPWRRTWPAGERTLNSANEVEKLGGMHVICTELHDAARIDRQLIGRCGRQGDHGSYRQYLSLDDDILKSGLGVVKSDKLKAR